MKQTEERESFMKECNVKEEKSQRNAGILLPVFALPSEEGIGTLGEGAYEFVDFLTQAGMRVWQVLPLLPTGFGDSPYQSCASNALNYYFIDLKLLVNDGLLTDEELGGITWCDGERIDYSRLFEYKAKILRFAFSRFNKNRPDWQAFLQKGKYLDYAVFMALKEKFAYATWSDWPKPYRELNAETIENFKLAHKDELAFWQFTQYVFLKQWNALKSYANESGVEIMGDMPIYVSYDSVETWKYREDLFMLGEDGSPNLRAGVPPDAFSEDGQLWGNPVYNWEKMESRDFDWWKKRIEYAFTLFDIVRIDHFRGFDRYYAVDQNAETAKDGAWRKGPGAKLFKDFKDRKIVAEDLGVIDEGVLTMMEEAGYPGMKVLSFGFDGDVDNEHKASNHLENIYAYTGTHDNAPVMEWLGEMDEQQMQSFLVEMDVENTRLGIDRYELNEISLDDLCDNIVEQAFASKANTTIVPMQDILRLGAESRINRPSSVSGGNWSFRFDKTSFTKEVSDRLLKLAKKYDRL